MNGRRFAGRVRCDPVIAGLTVLIGGAMLAMLLLDGHVAGQAILFWGMQPVIGLCQMMLAGRIARLPSVAPSARRLWRSISHAGVFLVVGDLSQLGYVLLHPAAEPARGTLVQQGLRGLWIFMIVAAVLRQPVLVTGRERLRATLDVATIMVAAATLAWHVLHRNTTDPWDETRLPSLLISGLMLVLVYAIARVTYGGAPPFSAGVALLGGVGASWLGLSTAMVPVTESNPTMALVLRLPPALLLLSCLRLQATRQQKRGDRGGVAGRAGAPRRRANTRLPYAALALVYVLLLLELTGADAAGVAGLWGVVIGMSLGAVLVVARQLLAFGEHARLRRALDDSLLEMSRNERRFRSLVAHASDVTLIMRNGVALYASPGLLRVMGHETDWLVGRHAVEYIHHDDLAGLADRLGPDVFPAGESLHCTMRGLHADGTWRWLEAVCTNLHHDPGVGGFVFNGRDVTENMILHERLRHRAAHDSLTGLANRTRLDERTREAARRDEVGGLLIDLDGFKAVNDTYGHHAGDALLVTVARRLTSCVREGDTVARLGGDEFAILLPDAGEGDIAELTRRIQAVLAEPAVIDGHRLPIRASIGSAFRPGAEVAALFRGADEAMYEAKKRVDGRDVGVRAAVPR